MLALVALPALVQGAPLFERSDSLSITIKAPMRELLRRRHSNPEFDAELTYIDATGVLHQLAFRLTTRGRSRLKSCSFPPLRLIFDPNTAKGTIFENQRRLKMVTQCKRGGRGADWVLQEFGIYRAYNVITDYSYRVRPLEVTFRDTKSAKWQRFQATFLIESTGEAARRLERDSIEPPEIEPEQFSVVETTHQLLFQYLIGNTDFAVKRGPTGEKCCHNGRVLAEPGRDNNWVVLPFDFDQAGAINTDYAMPNARLPIRRVSNRLYRGFCWQNSSLPRSIAEFNEHRDEITDALMQVGLAKSSRKREKRFIDRFYEIVNDADTLRREITNQCRGPRT